MKKEEAQSRMTAVRKARRSRRAGCGASTSGLTGGRRREWRHQQFESVARGHCQMGVTVGFFLDNSRKSSKYAMRRGKPYVLIAPGGQLWANILSANLNLKNYNHSPARIVDFKGGSADVHGLPQLELAPGYPSKGANDRTGRIHSFSNRDLKSAIELSGGFPEFGYRYGRPSKQMGGKNHPGARSHFTAGVQNWNYGTVSQEKGVTWHT